MAGSLKFYADVGLTTELASLPWSAATDGSSGSQDKIVYLGSVLSGKTFQASSNPGIDQIICSIFDTAIGSGQEAATIKLALSFDGLASAVGGASLNLGTSLLSGAGNAVPIYVRWTNVVATTSTDSNVSLRITTVQET